MRLKNRIIKQKTLLAIIFIDFATLGKSFFQEGDFKYYVGAFTFCLISFLIYKLIVDKT